MKSLPADQYESLKSTIKNAEVPGIFRSILKKQAHSVASNLVISAEVSTQINLFDSFRRQYETVLILASQDKATNYGGRECIDVTSIYSLIRGCHERFLALWYLSKSGAFPSATPEEEASFKHRCFLHGGFIDAQKNMKLRSHLIGISNLSKTLDREKSERLANLQNIEDSKIFHSLADKVKEKIVKFGAWRIWEGAELSWWALATKSPLNSAMAQYEYHTTSMCIHPSNAGMYADAQHDRSQDGLLAYLYVLAAFSARALYYISPSTGAIISDKEWACIKEFIDIGEGWISLPPVPEWE